MGRKERRAVDGRPGELASREIAEGGYALANVGVCYSLQIVWSSAEDR